MKKLAVLLLGLAIVGGAKAQPSQVGGGCFHLFNFYVNTIGTFGGPFYVDLTDGTLLFTESRGSYPMPDGGRILSLTLRAAENTSNGPILVTVRVNGTATSMSTIVPAGSSGAFNSPGNIPFGTGDLLSIEVDHSEASTGELRVTAALHYLVEGHGVAEVPFDRAGLTLLALALSATGFLVLALRRSTP